jgi:hypothetical protein
VGYLVTFVIVVVVGSILVAVRFVRSELRPEPRRSPLLGRRGTLAVAAGDVCECGGMIGRSARTSKRYGDLLGCTACNRAWTMDGGGRPRRRGGVAGPPPPRTD